MTDTTPLTDERLADISARHAAAQPGDWTAIRLEPNEHHKHPAYWVEARHDDGATESNLTVADCPWRMADAEFIAAAHADIPALLAEVRRLRAVQAAAYGFADEMADYCSPHNVAADYAQRLRDRLDRAADTIRNES